ncbi:hypothetical protein C2S51_010352 [Perilla frutescens var. frutescens]|nr:hypothetical protein C2S51_010352 [Perilla frutescens var. frutescens]
MADACAAVLLSSSKFLEYVKVEAAYRASSRSRQRYARRLERARTMINDARHMYDLEDERVSKFSDQKDEILKDLLQVPAILISHQDEVEPLRQLWQNRGFRPVVYCQDEALRLVLAGHHIAAIDF